MPLSPDAQASLNARARQQIRQLGLSEHYPFEPHFISTPQGAMHYLDEGHGSPVLMLHGNPTWSFLYRRLVKPVSIQHRAIVPDHIGFGLSDKPSNEKDYSIERHIDNLETLLLELDLTDVTLVMQDWGGPIGLGAAARHPDRIARLMILNTFGFYPPAIGMDPDNLKLPPPLLLMRSRGVGDFLVRRLGFFDNVVMKLATANSKGLKAVHHAYRQVFQNAAERAGVMAFPRLIPTTSSHPVAQLLLNETGPFLDRFEGPVDIVWGLKDPLFPVAALEAWKQRLPQAHVTELGNAKHYLQEDAPDIVIERLLDLLRR